MQSNLVLKSRSIAVQVMDSLRDLMSAEPSKPFLPSEQLRSCISDGAVVLSTLSVYVCVCVCMCALCTLVRGVRHCIDLIEVGQGR